MFDNEIFCFYFISAKKEEGEIVLELKEEKSPRDSWDTVLTS